MKNISWFKILFSRKNVNRALLAQENLIEKLRAQNDASDVLHDKFKNLISGLVGLTASLGECVGSLTGLDTWEEFVELKPEFELTLDMIAQTLGMFMVSPGSLNEDTSKAVGAFLTGYVDHIKNRK